MSADFSVQAMGNEFKTGTVTFVRSPEQRQMWHNNLSDEEKDDSEGVELYIVGHGFTFDEAFENAQIACVRAKSIPNQPTEARKKEDEEKAKKWND